MRLLNVITFRLQEFFDINVPPYAILSHTWGDDEVSFQDYQQPDKAKQKAGYVKIEHCCKQAVKDLLAWVWIDACCIDKRSSAELTEAINSMFQWYKNAKVCYAYLSDVQSRPFVLDVVISEFVGSRWFTRGWTLQELIAPRHLVFFDKNFKEFGTKARLCHVISSVTGISEIILKPKNDAGWADLNFVSIAKRMSWASQRQTTRIEDTAYCLMGLFGVNMPLLYGEGAKAFTRLQEEVLKSSEDQSLFSWTSLDTSHTNADGTLNGRGLLANSPAEFSYCGNVVPFQLPFLNRPYWMTNRGLRIDLPLAPKKIVGFYTAMLGCQEELGARSVMGIDVMLLESDKFFRVNPSEVRKLPLETLSEFTVVTVYVKMDYMVFQADNLSESFVLRGLENYSVGEYSLSEVIPLELWNPWFKAVRKISSDSPEHQVAGLLFEASNDRNFVVVLGFAKASWNPKPWTTIHVKGYHETLSGVMTRSRPRERDDIDEKGCEINLKDTMAAKVTLTTDLVRGVEKIFVDIAVDAQEPENS